MSAVVCVLTSSRLYRRTVLHCPSCERRHWFIVRWDGVWYGTTEFGSCGDSWRDGFLCQRPFERGWREKEQGRFQAMWACAVKPREWHRSVRADLRAEFAECEARR